MKNIEENTKGLKLAGLDEVIISDENKPIVGARALAANIGIILYSRKKAKAIVANLSCNVALSKSVYEKVRLDMYALLVENEMLDGSLYYKVIDGLYKSTQEVMDDYGNILSTMDVIDNMVKSLCGKNIVITDKENKPSQYVILDGKVAGSTFGDESKAFAFDTRNGSFVSNDVDFKNIYNNQNIKKI